MAAARHLARIQAPRTSGPHVGRRRGARHARADTRRRGDRGGRARGPGPALVDPGRHVELPRLGLQGDVRRRCRGTHRQDAGTGDRRRRHRGAGPHRAAGLRRRPRVFRQRRDVGHPQHPGRHGREHRRLQFAGRPVGIYGRGHRRRLHGHQHRDAARQAARRLRAALCRIRAHGQVHRRRQRQHLQPVATSFDHRPGKQRQHPELLLRGYSRHHGPGAGQGAGRQRQLHGAAARGHLDRAGRGGQLQRRLGQAGQDHGQLLLQPRRQPQRKPHRPADLHLDGEARALRRAGRQPHREHQPPLQLALRLPLQRPSLADDAHGVQHPGLPPAGRDLQPHGQPLFGGGHPLRQPPPQLLLQRPLRLHGLEQPHLPLPPAREAAAQPDLRRRGSLQRRRSVQPAAAVHLPRRGRHRGRYGRLRRTQHLAHAARTARLLGQRQRHLHAGPEPPFAHERRVPRHLRRQQRRPTTSTTS